MTMNPIITLDVGERRFTATSELLTASLRFRQREDRFIIEHTDVPSELSGHGLGGELVTAAIEYASLHGYHVLPLCPFAHAWLRTHPDVAATVEIDWPSNQPASAAHTAPPRSTGVE